MLGYPPRLIAPTTLFIRGVSPTGTPQRRRELTNSPFAGGQGENRAKLDDKLLKWQLKLDALEQRAGPSCKVDFDQCCYGRRPRFKVDYYVRWASSTVIQNALDRLISNLKKEKSPSILITRRSHLPIPCFSKGSKHDFSPAHHRHAFQQSPSHKQPSGDLTIYYHKRSVRGTSCRPIRISQNFSLIRPKNSTGLRDGHREIRAVEEPSARLSSKRKLRFFPALPRLVGNILSFCIGLDFLFYFGGRDGFRGFRKMLMGDLSFTWTLDVNGFPTHMRPFSPLKYSREVRDR